MNRDEVEEGVCGGDYFKCEHSLFCHQVNGKSGVLEYWVECRAYVKGGRVRKGRWGGELHDCKFGGGGWQWEWKALMFPLEEKVVRDW